jgi:murein DD-endopeptidase MepM/ murein hydrolase activator NlpD
MRISGHNALLGKASIKFVIAGFAAFLLAGCSDSMERFSANYDNPSDSDPVYTASLPKVKKVYRPQAAYKAPIYKRPSAVAAAQDTIEQTPIANAPVAQYAAPKYDYSNAYKKTYKQPKLVAETPVETQVAPVRVAPLRMAQAAPVVTQPAAPKFAYNNAPAYKAPTYKAPVIQDEQAAADEPVVQPKFVKKPALLAPKPAMASAEITVGPGMTLYSIAKANHVSVSSLASANNIRAPYNVSQGKVLKIPGAASAVEPDVAEAKPTIIAPKAVVADVAQVAPSKVKASGAEHVVASGDTLFSLGRQYSVSPFAIADLNGLKHDKPLSLGQKLRMPSGAAVAAATPAAPEKVDMAQKPAPLALPKAQEAETQVADAAPLATPSELSMRWPLRGKVISAFGPKTNGMKNEGINIAVPEGTNIQAAEAGVVAYAGNELKGYGNLILIRHAGGFVTAYAHASSLMVKKGDTIKRGQVIAKAGQTGAVQSPQLHFEVRKGATALDPTKYLGSATAMN